MASQLYTRTYCGKQLQWWLLQDECDPTRAPDLVFQDDPTFSPLTSAPTHDNDQRQVLEQLLQAWSSSSSSIEELVGVLLALYTQHNKARIAAACTDERILFELSMVEELGCTEVLLTGDDGSGPLQVRFTLPLPADITPAQQLLSCMRKLQHQQQQQQQDAATSASLQQQQQQQQQIEQDFFLAVCFIVSQGGSSSHIPVLQLKSPSWFTAQLPPLSLPAWDPHTSLLEYIPHLAERVTKHLSDHCPNATNRFLLMEGLSRLLGPPLELNMSLLQTSSSMGVSGGGLAAAAAAAGSRGHIGSAAGSAAGVWQVLFDQQPLLLFVELPRSYPADAPALCLQNLRRTGSDKFIALNNQTGSMPWSPRWPFDEQVARLFNFLKLQAATAGVVDSVAGSGGGGISAGSAAVGGTGQASSSNPPTSPGFYL